MSFESVYRLLEDRFRGPQSLIKERLEVYRPLIQELFSRGAPKSAVDLGCGRGEWLSICSSLGLDCYGVDQSDAMLDAARDIGLQVVNQDMFSYLYEASDESRDIISAFHVIEHLEQIQIQALIREAYRVLKPGGILILETPNYCNPNVASSTFYLDPTHRTPIHPELIRLYMEDAGFPVSVYVYLQGRRNDDPMTRPTMHQIFFESPYDLAIIASKDESIRTRDQLVAWSSRATSSSFDSIIASYDQYFQEKMTQLQENADTLSSISRRLDIIEGNVQRRSQRNRLTQLVVYLKKMLMRS